jgi:hypothetical protein
MKGPSRRDDERPDVLCSRRFSLFARVACSGGTSLAVRANKALEVVGDRLALVVTIGLDAPERPAAEWSRPAGTVRPTRLLN